MVFRHFVITAVLAFSTLTISGKAALSLGYQGNSDLCAGMITKAEMRETIPLHLLQAISLVESGKWDKDKGARVAWPWTVMAEGKGRYLPTKQAAIAEVKKLKAKGVRNIDVGCMQVNLHHHAKAFANLNDAFDPYKNVEYAAQFLVSLRKRSPSWTSAVGRYHSYNQEFSTPYRRKVLKAWRDEKHRLNKEMRLAAVAKKAVEKSNRERLKARKPGAVATTHIKSDANLSQTVTIPKTSSRKTDVAKIAITPPLPKPNTSRSIATRILQIRLNQES